MLGLVRMVMAVATIGAIAGCSTGSPGNQPSASPSVAQGAADCPFIDFRTPAGDRIDLTGTWHGNDDGYYSFYQEGSCVWATGTNAHHVLILRGAFKSDFTVPVEFAIVACGNGGPGCARYSGTDTLVLQFDADGEVFALQAAGFINVEGSGSGIAVTRWSRVSAPPLFPPPTPGI
jgi:hypothetical protein